MPRHRPAQLAFVALACAVVPAFLLPACGGASSGNLGGTGSSSSGGGSGGGSGSSGASSGGGSGGSSGAGSGSSGGGSGGGGSGGSSGSSSGASCDTKIHGTVWDPAKLKPVYNALVYIPTAALDTIASGPSCDKCGQPPSGAPAAVALSQPDGTFTMDNAPSGPDVRFVVQIGKWRRENAPLVTITPCIDNAIDAEVTRLPKNKAEGHLPHIALSTGLDTMECALQTMGVDPAELTSSTGTGAIHIYQGDPTYGATAGTGTALASTLWANAGTLNQYDMVIDACQGQAPTDKPQASLDNIVAFAGSGGRVYASHYEDFLLWPTGATSPWSTLATADTTAVSTTDTATNVTIDTAFPKGSALAQWVVPAGVSTTPGSIATINNARSDVLGVTAPTTAWMSGLVDGTTTNNIYQASFYAGSAACGKVSYSDFHVSAGTLGTAVFPGECAGAMADPGATALFEFFLFDAMSCAQDDTKTPVAPPL